MKIATFNINNVNRRLPNLLSWLKAREPDVVCLQELKSAHRDFPAEALHELGYRGVWRGEQTWNGVAILARNAEPVLVRTSLPGNRDDKQSRYIEAAVKGVLIGCVAERGRISMRLEPELRDVLGEISARESSRTWRRHSGYDAQSSCRRRFSTGYGGKSINGLRFFSARDQFQSLGAPHHD